MFKSFFPSPKWFFSSAVVWAIISIILWYSGGNTWGEWFGFPKGYAVEELPIGVSRFWHLSFIWFYIWFTGFTALFFVFWRLIANHIWLTWSIGGSAFIIFNIWFNVQVNVAVNAWYGPFGDLIQKMLSNHGGQVVDLYNKVVVFLYIAMVAVFVSVVNSFFVSHFIFRWRTAMTEYYTQHWVKLRHTEGASQRVQEDTMRFATIIEGLGVQLIASIMTLIAFFPILLNFSKYVTELPIVGTVPHALVWAGIGWAIFGTVLLIVVGKKLPGLEFNNQKVEAAYRKELVYGEDQADRAEPKTLRELFSQVRFNYFKLYFHYAYFNLVSTWYMQLDNIFGMFVLFPSIAAGTITLGLMNQILNVFDRVRTSFQYLIVSWKTIIELISIRKRLKAFEEHI